MIIEVLLSNYEIKSFCAGKNTGDGQNHKYYLTVRQKRTMVAYPHKDIQTTNGTTKIPLACSNRDNQLFTSSFYPVKIEVT